MCVIGLAPTHPLLQPLRPPKIKNIEYDTRFVNTINKKKQNPLAINSKICAITTEEGKKYHVKAGVVGWLTDINMRFNNNDDNKFDLLQNKVS